MKATRFLEIDTKIGSAAVSLMLEAALSTVPDVIFLYDTAEGLYLAFIV